MANLAEMKWYLSGGATGTGNTDTTKSTGGVITTTQILSQLATAVTTTITGVTLGDAAGNTLGNGTLTYTYSATAPTLRWTPYQGASGTAVDVSVNGTYAIQGANNGGILVVTVVSASLPGSSKSDTITITAQSAKIFDDVTKAQSHAGLTEYRCIYLKNTGTVATTDDKIDIEIYIDSNTTGDDVISIGLATQAPGTGTGVSGTDYPADTLTEAGVPAGVTFSAPTSAAPLTAFNLSSTAGTTFTKALWIKREVPAGTYTETLGNTFRLGYNVKV
jgi:hypothetical protein